MIRGTAFARVVALVTLTALAACPAAKPGGPTVLKDPVAIYDRDLREDLRAELLDEVLTSYARDEPPEIDTTMLPPTVGPARIGPGPGDVLLGVEIARAPSRWPLDVDPRTPTVARSKRIEVSLSADGSAAWVSDEVSWRIPMCTRVATIPLRLTALFARDGDRWVPVFEHLSFARVPVPLRADELPAKVIPAAVVSGDLRDALSGVVAQGLLKPKDRKLTVVALGPEALVLGPGIDDEWHGPDIAQSRLSDLGLRAEERRIGTVGRSPGTATIAYWVGNFVASVPARAGIPAGKARMRGTFVFEKREGNWVVVQTHVSEPITDNDLANTIFGTALLSPKPLETSCIE